VGIIVFGGLFFLAVIVFIGVLSLSSEVKDKIDHAETKAQRIIREAEITAQRTILNARHEAGTLIDKLFGYVLALGTVYALVRISMLAKNITELRDVSDFFQVGTILTGYMAVTCIVAWLSKNLIGGNQFILKEYLSALKTVLVLLIPFTVIGYAFGYVFWLH